MIFNYQGAGEGVRRTSAFALFGANRGPRPSVDGLVSVGGLGNGGPSTDSADGLGPRLAPNSSQLHHIRR